jgi:hypothetical protein
VFFITFSNLWSFSFFLPLTYLVFISSGLLYILPTLNASSRFTSSRDRSNFVFINALDLFWIVTTPIVLVSTLILLWSAPAVSAWFGHVVISSFQLKMALLVQATFATVTLLFATTSYFTSREVYDYFTTTISFLYWILLLFFSNSIFTSIFIIEVLSALIFLLLITSTFSSTFFYRNLDFTFGHLFQQSTPYAYLQSILYFFWVSLISSLNLFLFCLLSYIKLLTFDWYLLEHVFTYFTSVSTLKELFTFALAWFVLVFCLFLKCGIAPLYIWKPTFFKGIPFYTIFFYITFFYFFLFLFIIHLLTSYFSEIFFFYSLLTLLFLSIGLLFLLVLVCESYYFKAFLAISSILNSLFVLLALASSHNVDALLWL